ncbi:MAG: aldehyde dehydrogenase family protein, partial [Acidimicrobiia bacterium]|nr:aldehyde dehydrogenase family protein [Acidimicrobiia bacterium]
MNTINDQEVAEIIERVKQRLSGAGPRPGQTIRAEAELSEAEAAELGDGIYADVDSAVVAARAAFMAYRQVGLDGRRKIVDAIRLSMLEHAERLARMAHEETGLGRVEDKVRKNLLVTNKTPGPEDLEPEVVTGDGGMMVTEYAPYGVIGAITPTTNPTSTIINNAISIVSAGNAVVFNVHPNAKKVSAENVRLLNRAIVGAGGPPDLITAIPEPTIESAGALMHHPGVRVLLVTGG